MASALAALLLMSGCSGSNGEDAALKAARNDQGTRVAFDPANFVDPTLSTIPYHPLTPGTQWVYAGSTEVGSRTVPHGIVVTITDVIREINGVPTVAMLGESTDSGEISQTGMDYMALDKGGNVWILGGYDEDFEGGEYTNIDTSWLGSGEGQLVGILSPKEVTATTPGWFIGRAPQETRFYRPARAGRCQGLRRLRML